MNIDIKTFTASRAFRRLLCGVGALLLALVIFQAGVWVGYKKASFSYRLGDNYHRVFGERRMPFGVMMGDFPGAHGVAGKVVATASSTLVIEGPDGVEKNIMVTDKTIIKRFRDTIRISDIKVGDALVVIGSPDVNGVIAATLVRTLPNIEGMSMATSTKQ